MATNSGTGLKKLREINRLLNKIDINDIKPESRLAFINKRDQLAVDIGRIENEIIQGFLTELRLNESSLQKGIDNLNREIEVGNNIAKITQAIDKVLGVVTKILNPTRGIESRSLYALLVGIDDYSDHRLDSCANDITAIEEYLNTGFNLEEYQLYIKTLKNEQATREAIINGFRNHLCNAKKGDIALFYYSSHGSQEKAPKEFWHIESDCSDQTLVCYDSRTKNGWDLADKELALLIAEVAQKDPHIIIILDYGHSDAGSTYPKQETIENRDRADEQIHDVDKFIFWLKDLKKLSD